MGIFQGFKGRTANDLDVVAFQLTLAKEISEEVAAKNRIAEEKLIQLDEAIAQGLGAAARAATVLAQKRIAADGMVSTVDQALCRGCGICAAECPAKVIQLNWYEDDQVMSKVDALLEGVL